MTGLRELAPSTTPNQTMFRIDIPPSSVYGEMVRTQKREKTRVFSGRDEHEVERNARTNGYEYAKEDPKCTRGKCRQRWGRTI